ncbi:MAG TPA: hypothetical protein VNV87_06630, partial [Acidimicrobiales bacterium]|nr:hypothetical protein [Acidimicrobiales bacterium]
MTVTPSAAAETGGTAHRQPAADALAGRAAVRPGRAFLAVLGRDLFVTGRELPIFLAQVILQPFFFLFVFGRVLSELGY